MEKQHYKIRKDTSIGTVTPGYGGVLFYDIFLPDGNPYGYITNWIDKTGNVSLFSDNTHSAQPLIDEDLPF